MRRRTAALLSVYLATFLVMLDNSVVNLALPSIYEQLDATVADGQWIINAYILALASTVFLGGALGDRYGRKRVLLIGVAGFTAASVVAALAPTVGVLVAARVALGLSAALMWPATLAIIFTLYEDEPDKLGRGIAGWAAMNAAGLTLGPVVSGVLLAHFWWGSVFFIAVPFGAVAFVATVAAVPEHRSEGTHPLDLRGVAAVSAAALAAITALIAGPSTGWTSLTVLAGASISAVAVAVFVWWERRAPSPMLPPAMFRRRGFNGSAAAIFVTSALLLGSMFILMPMFQSVRGFSTTTVGLASIPWAVAIVAASLLSPAVVNRVGLRGALLTGASLVAVSAAATAALYTATVPITTVGVVSVLFGAGLGISLAAATTGLMQYAPPEHAGVVAAVNDTCREFGNAVGVAVGGAVLATLFAARFDAGDVALEADGHHLSLADLDPTIEAAAHAAYETAFRLTMGGVTVAAVALAVVVWALLRPDTQPAPADEATDEKVPA